jgi:hypothetical protein
MPGEPTRVLYVPDAFDFLDPNRPEIGYVGDMTPEERQEVAPLIEKQKALAASGTRLGPPWKVQLEDGTEVTFGGESSAS